MEVYLATHSEATFTHSMCPDCAAQFKAFSAAEAGKGVGHRR